MISILLLFACSVVTHALDAHEVGLYHTKAFELLGEKYATTGPNNKLDVMSDTADVLSSFCEDPVLELKLDFDCKSKVDEMITKILHANGKKPQTIEFPADFDPLLRMNLEMIKTTLSRLDENNFDDVLQSLTNIHNDLSNMENVDEAHKLIAISGSSIAIESLKLWHGAFTDSNHYLRNLVSYRQQNRRNLQTVEIEFGPIMDVVNADVTGAVTGTFDTFFSLPFLIFSPPMFPLMALYFGIIASANAASDSGEGADGKDF